MMKVLYDISLLGMQHKINNNRTGVFRVVENLVDHLAVQKDCDLRLCSMANNFAIPLGCLDYLETNPTLSATSFILPPYLKERAGLNKKRYQLIDAVGSNELGPLNKLPAKFQIRNLWLRETIYNKLYNSSFAHASYLNGADVYHSPINPIPRTVVQSKVKSIFLTSYDLIAVLHPEYFEKVTVAFVESILNSITPDTWVLCISAATRNDLLNYLGNKVNPERVGVTELAASERFYQSTDKEGNKEVRKEYGIPEVPYILSLCTLEPRKNIDSVIKAFTRVVEQENIPGLNLVLGGAKGWLFDKVFNELEASAAIKNRIIVTGHILDKDLAAIYSDALLFVYPSFYEGFGLPPLEAMQCGTPVITSNTSSLPEVVGDAGIMVSPTDLDALCSAMLSIYKDPSLRDRLSEQSLQRAGRFSWERCAQETTDAYKRSLTS